MKISAYFLWDELLLHLLTETPLNELIRAHDYERSGHDGITKSFFEKTSGNNPEKAASLWLDTKWFRATL